MTVDGRVSPLRMPLNMLVSHALNATGIRSYTEGRAHPASTARREYALLTTSTLCDRSDDLTTSHGARIGCVLTILLRLCAKYHRALREGL